MIVKTDDKVIVRLAHLLVECDGYLESAVGEREEAAATTAGLRVRALTAERERDKALKERDEARRQHHAACEQRDAAHERADRLQKQIDTRPTRGDLEAVAASRLEDFYAPYAADEARVIVARMVADFPDLVRPDDPAPTEQDDTPSEWAPGTDVTDRWSQAPDGLHMLDGAGDIFHVERCRGFHEVVITTQRNRRLSVSDADAPGRVTMATPEDLAAAGIEAAE